MEMECTPTTYPAAKRSTLHAHQPDAYCMGVYSLCRDCEDNIWIGTYTGGAFLMMPEETSTTLLRHRKGEEPSLADDNVNAFCEQSNGELWIATDNGISIYNPQITDAGRYFQAMWY